MRLFKLLVCFAFMTVALCKSKHRGRPDGPGKSKLGSQRDHVIRYNGRKEYIKSDMGLNKGQYKKLYGKDPEEGAKNAKMSRRSAAISDSTSYWPNARVPLHRKFTGFTDQDKDDFERVVKFIENVTCLSFPDKTSSDTNWAKVESCDAWDEGCWSYLGMGEKGSGEQPVCLGTGCHEPGTYVHELGHLVGLMHEQERSDRDDNIVIHWENVMENGKDQFVKAQPGQDIRSKYDFSSTMHYERTFFSKDGSHTISAKNPADNSKFVDTTYRMFDFYDSMVLNIIYKCAAKCSSQYCSNGYMDKNCKCITPDVFALGQCYDIEASVDCENWSADCTDSYWRSWMEYYCRKTCNKC